MLSPNPPLPPFGRGGLRGVFFSQLYFLSHVTSFTRSTPLRPRTDLILATRLRGSVSLLEIIPICEPFSLSLLVNARVSMPSIPAILFSLRYESRVFCERQLLV